MIASATEIKMKFTKWYNRLSFEAQRKVREITRGNYYHLTSGRRQVGYETWKKLQKVDPDLTMDMLRD